MKKSLSSQLTPSRFPWDMCDVRRATVLAAVVTAIVVVAEMRFVDSAAPC